MNMQLSASLLQFLKTLRDITQALRSNYSQSNLNARRLSFSLLKFSSARGNNGVLRTSRLRLLWLQIKGGCRGQSRIWGSRFPKNLHNLLLFNSTVVSFLALCMSSVAIQVCLYGLPHLRMGQQPWRTFTRPESKKHFHSSCVRDEDVGWAAQKFCYKIHTIPFWCS